MVYLKKRKETQKQINDAFIELYRKNRPRLISVKDICEAAGINRSTFYTYYDDVYKVQSFVQEEIQDKIIETFRGIQVNNRSFDPAIIIIELVKFFKANRDLPFELICDNRGALLQKIQMLIKDGFFFDTSKMAPEDFKRIGIALKYHIAGAIDILDDYLVKNRDMDVDDVIAILTEIASNGVYAIAREYLK